jgi:Homeodomain-like domain
MNLEDEMRQILARMSLLMYGKTASLNSSGGRSENPDPRPQGESWTLADKWAAEWARSATHETVEAARVELESWLKRSAPAEGDDSTFEEWVLEDGKGFAVAQVASRFGIAPQRVVRLRLKYGRDAEFGMLTVPETHAEKKDKSRARVLSLAGQGMTVRQIQSITDVPRETVRRWMKEAA